MANLLAEAIEAKQSDSPRRAAHHASDGRLTPSFSATDPTARHRQRRWTGRRVFEINVDTVDVNGDLELMRHICRVGGRPLSVGLLQRPAPGDTYRRVLEGFEGPRDGLVMPGQAAARPTDSSSRGGR